MSNKQTIINEINDLYRAPTAFIYLEDVYKVVSWGACKSYLSWPDGAPLGWDELQESTEFFVGRMGTRFVAVTAADDAVIKLYARSEDAVDDTADTICYELEIETDAYEMWQ